MVVSFPAIRKMGEGVRWAEEEKKMGIITLGQHIEIEKSNKQYNTL